MTYEATKFVDARGLRCPLPVLRLRRAVQGFAGAVELLTDDPAAERDVPAFAAERGWTVATRRTEGRGTRWTITVVA